MSATLPFTLVVKLLTRENNRLKRDSLPELSLPLSDLDGNMKWHVKDVNNNDVALVDGERVEWCE